MEYIERIGDWPALNNFSMDILNFTSNVTQVPNHLNNSFSQSGNNYNRSNSEEAELRIIMTKFRNYGVASLFVVTTNIKFNDPRQSIIHVSFSIIYININSYTYIPYRL